jgi:transaldolase
LPADGGDAESTLAEFARAGVDEAALAEQLLREGTQAFDNSWSDLMQCIVSKVRLLGKDATERTGAR